MRYIDDPYERGLKGHTHFKKKPCHISHSAVIVHGVKKKSRYMESLKKKCVLLISLSSGVRIG